MKAVGTGADHIMGPGATLTRPESPELSITCRRNITGYHRDMRGYPMTTSEVIGEDGSGKDIGTGMKDGGKADAEDPREETTLDPIMDAADLHLHLPDLLEDETVMIIGIETTALAEDNARSAKSRGQNRWTIAPLK